jgi:hypothetical protein
VNAPAKFKAHYPTKPKIKLAVETARELGLDVAGFEICPDGTVRVMEARAKPAAVTDFDRFEAEL